MKALILKSAFLISLLFSGGAWATCSTTVNNESGCIPVADGALAPSKLASQAAGTVLGNTTGSSASPTAVAAGTVPVIPDTQSNSTALADLLQGRVWCTGVAATDTANIQAAVNSQQIVTILDSGNVCNINNQIDINKTGVTILGSGMDAGHQTGVETGNTIIKYTGSVDSAKAMFSVQPGALATRHLSGVTIKGITLDADSKAGYGVRIRSAYYTYLDVRVIEASVAGVYLGTLDTLTGDGTNTQYTSGRVSVRQTSTDGGSCFVFDGSQLTGVAGNASFNTLESIACTIGNGDGVVFKASDNNQIRKVSVSRQPSGTTGRDVRFQGSNGTGTPLIPNVARANRIDIVSASDGSDGIGGITYEGTELWTNPSHDNVVTLDKDNGTPPPIVGTDVLGPLYWSLNDGVMNIGPTMEFNMALNRIRSTDGTNLRLIAPAGNSVWIGTFDNATAVQVSPGLRAGTGLTDQGLGTFNFAAGLYVADALTISTTDPTISSGFGTTPSIAAANGTAAFTVNVGTGGTASAGVIGLPAATTGWICSVNNVTAKAANRADQGTFQTATTTTTVTIQNQTISTGAALAWTASDIIQMICTGY